MAEASCPRCGKREVRIQPRNWCASTYGLALRLTFWRYARFRFMVCTACGFVEPRIEDRKALDFITSRWERAS
jgi:hypothetical protein